MDKYRLCFPHEIAIVWRQVSPWIVMAIGRGEYFFDMSEDLEYIKKQLTFGQMQLWVGLEDSEINLVAITEEIIYAGKKTLVVRWLSAKNMEEKLPDIGIIEFWAKGQGFYAIHIYGRKGWEKAMKPLGYTHEFTALARVIDRGMH